MALPCRLGFEILSASNRSFSLIFQQRIISVSFPACHQQARYQLAFIHTAGAYAVLFHAPIYIVCGTILGATVSVIDGTTYNISCISIYVCISLMSTCKCSAMAACWRSCIHPYLLATITSPVAYGCSLYVIMQRCIEGNDNTEPISILRKQHIW